VTNPFYHPDRPEPFVALAGNRGGYLQVAANRADQTCLVNVPTVLPLIAMAWAQTLEHLGALRVYWFCLSEAQSHYHWHIYPRWLASEPQGWPLFAQREEEPDTWTPSLKLALSQWAHQHNIFIYCTCDGLKI
jgi:hypothetical protein